MADKGWLLIYETIHALQAKKSEKNLKEVTHKVYFDIEIDGKAAGTFFTCVNAIHLFIYFCFPFRDRCCCQSGWHLLFYFLFSSFSLTKNIHSKLIPSILAKKELWYNYQRSINEFICLYFVVVWGFRTFSSLNYVYSIFPLWNNKYK